MRIIIAGIRLVNLLTHTTNLQQTTLKTSRQKHRKTLKMKVLLLKKVENIVAKEEVASFEQFLLRHNVFKSCPMQIRQNSSEVERVKSRF